MGSEAPQYHLMRDDILSEGIFHQPSSESLWPAEAAMSSFQLMKQQRPAFAGQMTSPTKSEWDKHRPNITALYRDEKRSLKEVTRLMHYRHVFRATTKMYKTKLAEWGIRKNLTWSDRENVCQLMRQNSSTMPSSKDGKIIVNGQERSLAVFVRHMRQSQRRTRMRDSLTGLATATNRENLGNGSLRTTGGDSAIINTPTLHIYRTMYPAEDERSIEIICTGISQMCLTDLYDLCGWEHTLEPDLIFAIHFLHEKRFRDARILFNRAIESFRAIHPTLAVLGIILVWKMFSNVPSAYSHFRSSFLNHLLELSRTIHGPEHPTTTMLALIPGLANGLNATLSSYRCAIAALQKSAAHGTFDLVIMKLRRRLANALGDAGHIAEAESIYRALIDECDQPETDDTRKITTFNSAAVYYSLHGGSDELEKARQLYQMISEVGARATDENNRLIAALHVSNGLADIAERTDDLLSAIEYKRREITYHVRVLGEDSSEAVFAAEELARLLSKQGRLEEAAEARSLYQLTDDMEDLTME